MVRHSRAVGVRDKVGLRFNKGKHISTGKQILIHTGFGSLLEL